MSTLTATPESIRMHSEQSGYYAYRTPYIPPLFDAVCRELNMHPGSRVMDLACGRGEVSNLLAPHAGTVYAVDGSADMIALATHRDNIHYQVADLNSVNPRIDGRVDHLFFGRSIHWFTGATLQRLSRDVLKEDGRIVVCSTQWRPSGDWGAAYTAVRNRFVPQNPNASQWDFTGQTPLGEAGFTPVRRLNAQATLQATSEFMIGHTFATTYGEHLRTLEQQTAEFTAALRQALAPYEQHNALTWNISSWALVYART